jgi:hypothetical protein
MIKGGLITRVIKKMLLGIKRHPQGQWECGKMPQGPFEGLGRCHKKYRVCRGGTGPPGGRGTAIRLLERGDV